MIDPVTHAISALGAGALTESSIQRHIYPLFSGTLASQDIYLENHSLGRPLDATEDDLREACGLWRNQLGNAWGAWLREQENHRGRIAELIGARRPDCIIPKTSAGQGLRTVLNALPGKPKVISTKGEFDSVDLILKQYATLGRIDLHLIDADSSGQFHTTQLIDSVGRGGDLVVVSQVMFMSGQVMENLDALADACHRTGARLLVDAYHAVGVFPVDVHQLHTDFMIGGCYKYLRGGPGACFLYISPEALSGGLANLDAGWFAKENPFQYERPDPTKFASGGDAFLGSTPPVFTYYQARAGQRFTLGIGVERLRAYTLDRLMRLKQYLGDFGIATKGADQAHGAFLSMKHPNARNIAEQLAAKAIHCDARSDWLRLSPDCLTPDKDLRHAARTLASIQCID